MNDTVRDAIHEALTEDEKAGFISHILNVLSVKYGDKPGCTLTETIYADDLPYDPFLFDTLDLDYTTTLYKQSHDAYQLEVTATTDKQRLEWFEPYQDIVRKGIFLGYPESSIKWYWRTQQTGVSPSLVHSAWITHYFQNGKLTSDDLQYLSFINYIPRPTLDDTRAAIDHGRHRYTTLKEIAKNHDHDALDTALEAIRNGTPNYWEQATISFPQSDEFTLDTPDYEDHTTDLYTDLSV